MADVFKIMIPYTDHCKLLSDSTKLENVISILNTKFPDDTCQLIAIKTILGIVEPEEDVEEEPEDSVKVDEVTP